MVVPVAKVYNQPLFSTDPQKPGVGAGIQEVEPGNVFPLQGVVMSHKTGTVLSQQSEGTICPKA